MTGKIKLTNAMFADDEKILYESESFVVTTFKYSTGVEAVTLKNSKGYVTLLPFMGQMIWDIEFLGRNLVMKSIYDEPEVCYNTYGESYGCFLMHCGLTAMGNPTAEDTHLPHGELPIAKYRDTCVIVGEDEKGSYVALSGTYYHKRAFEHNYEFVPVCKLYEDASTIDVEVNIINNKDLPLEYFYLCHINHRPIDGSKLLYTAKHENIEAHHEVPEGYHLEKETNDYLAKLDKDMSIMDTIDKKSQSYAPEIVFTCRYEADEEGYAHTMQILPDGYACYVSHRPEELPYGVRWIARTDDEDALGMVLPATSQHMGYIYCKQRGQEKYVESKKSVTFHLKTGLLTPDQAKNIANKIEKVMK